MFHALHLVGIYQGTSTTESWKNWHTGLARELLANPNQSGTVLLKNKKCGRYF